MKGKVTPFWPGSRKGSFQSTTKHLGQVFNHLKRLQKKAHIGTNTLNSTVVTAVDN